MIPAWRNRQTGIEEGGFFFPQFQHIGDKKLIGKVYQKNRCSAEKPFRQNCISWLSLVRQDFTTINNCYIPQSKHLLYLALCSGNHPLMGRGYPWGLSNSQKMHVIFGLCFNLKIAISQLPKWSTSSKFLFAYFLKLSETVTTIACRILALRKEKKV